MIIGVWKIQSAWGNRHLYKILVRKHLQKEPLGRSRLGREDNMKRDVEEMRCKVVDWINLVQNGD
jgi:hypothetical protein